MGRTNNKFNQYYVFPCKNCQERNDNCWDTCEKYLKSKADYEKIKQRERYEKDSYTDWSKR